MIHILAISGSLRNNSSNTTLLRVAVSLAPADTLITLYDGIGRLPHFNPDLADTDIATVSSYRNALKECDGVLICSPEYAHGVPGVLKNALDWIVASGELIEKPVMLLNASARSTFAIASLTETITVMMGRIIPEASISLQLPTNKLTEGDIMANAELIGSLQAALVLFADEIGRNGDVLPG